MKKLITTLMFSALIMLSGCQTTKKETMNSNDPKPFYVGTYTQGESQGIYKYALQHDGTLKKIGLAAKSNNPSFLTRSLDGKYLVAVNEIKNDDNVGTVESYLISDDTLKLLNRRSSGGAHPCFVAINKTGSVLAANYTGGNVGYLQLDSTGRLSELLDVQQHTGKGTTERQTAPHAHSAWFNPVDGNIIAVDLGTNELWFSTIDPDEQKLLPADKAKLAMDPGDGPRHLTFHPNGKWLYVVNELTSTVTQVFQQPDGSYTKGKSVSTLPAHFSEPNTCADIHISSDGNFVYASNRGHNSIAVLKVDPADGTLKLLGNKGCGGDGPRNFSLSPDEKYILVANQHTNNIVSLKRNETTGLLKYVSQIEAPTPVCIIF